MVEELKKRDRITAEDTVQSMMLKMSDGNPGACTAMIEMFKNGKEIDPMSAFGGMGSLLSLDSYGIYGSDIWLLYNDICKRNVAKTIGLIRCCQMGIVSNDRLKDVIFHARKPFDEKAPVLDIHKSIHLLKEQLPEFDPENKCGLIMEETNGRTTTPK